MSKEEPIKIQVQPNEAGRVDLLLGQHFPQSSRKRLRELFASGSVQINGKRVKKGAFVQAGDQVTLARAPASNESLRAKANHVIQLDILYQDEHLVVINKAPGLASHPLVEDEIDTVANGLVALFPECQTVGADPREAGLLHRLDRFTSGILVAARDQETWERGREIFHNKEVSKKYLALVEGIVTEPGSTDMWLRHSGAKMKVSPFSDETTLTAKTTWTPQKTFHAFSLLECATQTGRMHQVRVHLAHVGFPIFGDILYGGLERSEFAGHFLHALEISFPHPQSGNTLVIQAPLPKQRSDFLETLAATT